MSKKIIGIEIEDNYTPERLAYMCIMRTRMVLYKLEDKKLQYFDSSLEQYMILTYLYNRQTPIFPSEIAKSFFRRPCTVTSHLQK